MIASEVRDQSFQRNMKDWVQADDCLANRCSILSHISRTGSGITGPTCTCDVFPCTSSVDALEEETQEQHDETMWKWSSDLAEMNGRSKIAKCVRVCLIICSSKFTHNTSYCSFRTTPMVCIILRAA